MPTMLTAPATPDAATWQGWGTALKPAWEPIILACAETGTVLNLHVGASGFPRMPAGAPMLELGATLFGPMAIEACAEWLWSGWPARHPELKIPAGTDPAGALVARTDRPSASGDDLSGDPIVKRAIEGEDSATLWRQGDELFTAVAVPMQTGPELVGVLVAGMGERVGVGERSATRLGAVG